MTLPALDGSRVESALAQSQAGQAAARDEIAASVAVQLALEVSGDATHAATATGVPNDEEKFRYLSSRRTLIMPVAALLFLPALLSLSSYVTSVPGGFIFLPFVGLLWVNWSLGLWSNSKRSRYSMHSHAEAIRAYAPTRYPSIDVFLPTCGEPLEVLVGVYSHVRRLHWRGPLNVYVLDDAQRSEVQEAARHFGFTYIVRPNRGHMKKAGNLRHAFGVTSGDFVLVLDADFSPRSDMLNEIMPHFVDDIGILQTPQFFDTNANQSWVQRSAGATQEMFYRWVQPSRDRRNAAICVGTNAVYRRAALQAIGGFFEIEHSEDVHTGFEMKRHGYEVRYLPIVLAKGLCPDQLPQFIVQQYRWATGSLSLSTSRKFWTASHIPWRSRLPFLTGFLYYIVTGIASVVAFAPGPFLMWVSPDLLSPRNYLPFLGCYLGMFALMPWATSGRLTPSVHRIQMTYSFSHLVAMWDAATRRTEGWVATGTRKVSSKVVLHVLRLLTFVPLASLAFAVSGLTHAIIREGFHPVWPASIMLLHQIWLSVPLAVSGFRELRKR